MSRRQLIQLSWPLLTTLLVAILVRSAQAAPSAAHAHQPAWLSQYDRDLGEPIRPVETNESTLTISWTIEPESSAEAPLIRDFVLARIETPVPGAGWYKVERVTDSEGSGVVENDRYYPQWFDQLENVFRFTSTRGQNSADSGPIYLRVSAWSEKEGNGGVRISEYSNVLAVHYDHSFENLEFDIVVEVDEQRPGEALLRAVPRDAGLAAQIELYSWQYYVPQDDGTGDIDFVREGLVQLAVEPELRVSLPEAGVRYIGFFGAWNGTYGSGFATPASGLRSRPAPRTGGQFVPIALIIPPEDGPPDQVVPGFTGPVYQLPPIPGDIRFPLLKEEISLFSSGSLYMPLGGAKPITVEVQLPQGVELLDYQPARTTPNHSYTVADVSDQVTDGSLPPGYRRYRLIKDRPDRDWSYYNRVLPLYFRFTSQDVIGRDDLFMHLRAYNPPEDAQRQDNWQILRVRCEAIPDVPLPRRLSTGITWASSDLFPGPSADPSLSFLATYRRLGFNTVPFVGSHWRDPAVYPELYYFPEERTGPEWEELLYGPEHSTFYNGFQGEGMFSLLKWDVKDMDNFDFSEFNLTPKELEEEKRKWRNALEYYAHPDVTRPDLAYDGIFFRRDLANLATVLEAAQPDYIFIDSEDFPSHAQWVSTVALSQNAQDRRLPDETDDDLANRIAQEFLEAVADTVSAASPGTKTAFFATAPLYNYGYRAFRWQLFQDLGIVAQPSLYKIERLLDRYGEYLRLNRQALPPDYELIPWITTGTYGEMEPARVFDLITHLFLNGATGFSVYSFSNFDDMADYLNIARAIALLAPHEEIIVDGELAFEDISDVENAVVSAMQLNDEYLIVVTPQDPAQPVAFTVHAQHGSRPHTMYDLRHGTQQVYESGTVRVTAELTEGTVYRLVPVPPAEPCVQDVNANGIGDVLDIMTTASELTCHYYLPVVVANWRQPWPAPTPDVTIRSDLTAPGSPLPALLKPSANLHPMWGDRNQAPIDWWQAEVPRWQEGTYLFWLDLWHIEEGAMNLAQGRYPDTLTRFAGPEANTFVLIVRVPASLQPPECQAPDPAHPRWVGRCAPTSYEAYQKVLEALLIYLSVPGVVMPDNQATQILGIVGQPSLGLDGLRYIFWHESNAGQWNWRDGTAAWLQLYDYWTAAVRAVRAAYPQVRFEVGTEFQGSNFEDGHPGPHVEHSELLAFLQNQFLPFLNGQASERIPSYEYRADPPLDLELYPLNLRRNENHFWLNDWDDSDGDGQGFFAELTEVFSSAGFNGIQYVNWALQSSHLQVQAPVLPESGPDTLYWGAERDSEIGAAAQVALQHDVERSPVIDISYAWAEFLSDAGEDVNDFLPWDFPLYCGATGNAFTYAYYAKPTYNVMRMLGMQETTRVPAEITDTASPPKRDYVGAVVTRDETGGSVVILLWYYIPPEDLESVAGRRYEDLRTYADTHLRIDLEVVLDGLGEGSYRLERYLVDETHSNGFHYRQQIADAKAPAAEVNGWLPGNNPYNASVALELVEARDGLSPDGGTLRLRYEGVAPWTVMLVDLHRLPDQ